MPDSGPEMAAGETAVRAGTARREAMAENNDLVLYEVDEDGVATVTLNRPERKNAWSIPMERRFFALLDEAAQDPAVKVVIITGAGRAFCPGMDMQRLEQNSQPGESLNLQARAP